MRSLLALLTLACSVLAEAQTTYHVAPDGYDAGSGRAAEPFRTVKRGIEALAPGDTLVVADGVYREGGSLIVEDLVATPERPTVIRSATPWGAKIEGVVYHAFLLFVRDCRHLVVDGFEVYHPGEGTDEDWSTGISVQRSDYVTVRNCYVHDCGCGGFGGRTGDYLTFEDNVAVGNARDSPYNCSGISIYHPRQLDDAPGPHIVLRGNVTFGNACRLPFSVAGFTTPTDGNGIILDDFANDQPDIDPDGSANPGYRAQTLIEGNLSFGNGGAGIKTYKVPNAVIRRNTAYHNNYVLADFGGSVAEIGFEDADAHCEAYDNIAVAAPGRTSNAFYYAPWSGANSETTRLSAKRNLFVGQVDVKDDTLSRRANTLLPAFRQSYAAFANAVDTVRAFANVEELRDRFRLRPGSPAIGKGAFAKTRQVDTPLPPDPVPVAVLYNTPAPIAIDGTREGWYTAPKNALTSFGGNATSTAYWWGAYDADYLYVYIEVSGTGTAPTVLFGRDAPDLNPTPAVVVTPDRSVTSYEYRFPLSAVPRADGDSTLLAINVFARHRPENALLAFRPLAEPQLRQLAFPGPAATATPAGLLGLARLRAVPTPPLLPRDVPGPAHVLAHPIGVDALAPDDLAATWRAHWDATALHLHVSVTDDTLTQDSGDAWYQDDGLEVYLDLDNAKTFNDYDPNDRQLSVGLDGRVAARRGSLGPGARATVERTAAGYVVALALPWSALGVAAVPPPGTFLGLDVHVNDDDDGGARDGKLAWYAERDESHRNAALFGVVALGK